MGTYRSKEQNWRNRHEKTCGHCQRTFFGRNEWNLRYCSERCARSALNERRKPTRREDRKPRHGDCIVYGHPLPNEDVGRSTRRYRCNECRQRAYRDELQQCQPNIDVDAK